MRSLAKTLSLGAAILAGSLTLVVSSAAEAGDRHGHRHGWHHKHDHHWRHGHRHHWRDREVYVRERPVYVRERPVVVERPVYMAPPMMYNPGPSGMNLNFNIPLN